MADVTTDIASNGSLQTTEFDALVIGAGFAGLHQLLCLRDRLGLSVKALAILARDAIPKAMSIGTLSPPS